MKVFRSILSSAIVASALATSAFSMESVYYSNQAYLNEVRETGDYSITPYDSPVSGGGCPPPSRPSDIFDDEYFKYMKKKLKEDYLRSDEYIGNLYGVRPSEGTDFSGHCRDETGKWVEKNKGLELKFFKEDNNDSPKLELKIFETHNTKISLPGDMCKLTYKLPDFEPIKLGSLLEQLNLEDSLKDSEG